MTISKINEGRLGVLLVERDGSEREWQSTLTPRYRRSSREVCWECIWRRRTGGGFVGHWNRCLMGRPRLVISDGNPGLAAALDRLWPGVRHQRCTVNKLRNLVAKVPKHAHEAVRKTTAGSFTREPQVFQWDVVERFEPAFEVVGQKQYEKSTIGVHESLLETVPFDHKNPIKRYGVLWAKFQKLH